MKLSPPRCTFPAENASANLDQAAANVDGRPQMCMGRVVAEKRPYLHSVGHSERTGESIEPRLSLQWWVKVESLAKAAGDAVRVALFRVGKHFVLIGKA